MLLHTQIYESTVKGMKSTFERSSVHDNEMKKIKRNSKLQ